MGNVNLMKYLNFSLSGPMSRILALAPSCVEDPLTYTDQESDRLSVSIGGSLSFDVDWRSISCCFWKVHSATKSASVWDFIDFLGRNSKPYSLSSITVRLKNWPTLS